MSYFPTHRYLKADDGNYCGVADNRGVDRGRVGACCQPAGHPIHDVGNLPVEDLAIALAAHRWRTPDGDARIDDQLAGMTAHRNHSHHSDCAICARDVHAIAAFAINFLTPPPPTNGYPLDEPAVRLAGELADASARLVDINRRFWNARHPGQAIDLRWPSHPTPPPMPDVLSDAAADPDARRTDHIHIADPGDTNG